MFSMAIHFRKVERIYFLCTKQEVIHIALVEWDTAANMYDKKYTTSSYSVDSIKYEYYSSCKTMPHAGNPSVLEYLLLLQQLYKGEIS